MSFARAMCCCVLTFVATGRIAVAQPSGTPAGEVQRDARWLRAVRSISLSGYGVAQSTARSVPDDPFSLLATELDGAIEFGRALQGAVALVYDGTRLAMPVGFLDLHVGGARIAPRGGIFAERGFHLQAGRFDLPFGGDWQRFAPPDRALSSAPAVTDLIADGGLNDMGVRAFSVGAQWNASAWLVQGALAGRALGARVALTPFSNPFVFRGPASARPFEIGLSTHLDGRDGRIVDQRAAFDVDLRHGDFNLAAEWQDRRVVHEVQGLAIGRARGWHLSTELPVWSPGAVGTLVLARWEAMRGDALGTPGLGEETALRRAVAGIRVDVGSWVVLKCEVGWRLGAPERNGLSARSWLLDAMIMKW